ncbi:MAG: CmcJ/NvfI family oxidoreductase [Pseudomonadota bacterium]
MASGKVATASIRTGMFNYLDPGAEPSLFRNGKVLTKRDVDGSDAGYVGVHPTPYTVEVNDARQRIGTERMRCETNGFELLSAPLDTAPVAFLDHEQVIQLYYPACEELVSASTGAVAFAFDHNVRSASGNASGQRIDKGQAVQGPAKMVHGDYTLTSAPARLRDLASPPNSNDTLRGVLAEGESLISNSIVEAALAEGGRFAIINVWRNIAEEPVQTNPLAMCDGQTVNPEDLVTFEIHYADRIGENYFAKYQERHRFYFYPEMTRDEAMLLKQWDSAGALATSGGKLADAAVPDGPCTFSFHSAFDDLTAANDAPDRWSIEVRCLVIYT